MSATAHLGHLLRPACACSAAATAATRRPRHWYSSSSAPPPPRSVKPVIGLEFHAQIASSTKLLSPMSANYFGRPPNTATAPFDLALPGSMPVLQLEPVVLALATAIALGCDIPPWSRFDRKHYFYADLPNGFQVTQKYYPIALNGALHLTEFDGLPRPKSIGIEQLQLEQDTGKSFHHDGKTFIDYNRAGMPLMEIVTRPDIESPKEAAAVVKSLQSLMRTLATCDANLEEGSLRVDVNVSVQSTDPCAPVQSTERVEIKNISTVSGLVTALDSEITRHTALLHSHARGSRETRGYDAATGTTFLLRSKESAKDYRFISDAELPRLVISASDVAGIKAVLPELPAARRARVADQFGAALNKVQLAWLTDVCPLNAVAEEEGGERIRKRYVNAISGGKSANDLGASAGHARRWPTAADFLAAMHPQSKAETLAMYNWLANDLAGRLASRIDANMPVTKHHGWGVTPEQLASIPRAIAAGHISGKAGKLVLDKMVLEGDDRVAMEIAQEYGWVAVTDKAKIREWAMQVIAKSPPRKAGVGDDKYVTWLVGQVVKESRGKAEPKVAREVVSQVVKELGGQ
ncbi:GatB/GatE catalytic domain-domain-containing protein [Catenaria anguillulae PL171]|uniref:Glutamyl-tRNA(Gln) amidotransferase subunit B, mitochondrial n=1 Tax=Catenaria anguillulae PL171 TaxID=765915 RepID=A0A1Y2HLY3_9FUNG|nr:GatB/GatE catalytic domain-domain-containing protein [Catenaria anguillulae PL171]